MFYLASTAGEPTVTRLAVLLGFGFFKGCALGPIIAISLRMDPSIALTAFVGTAAAFSCFSLAALISKRRSFLYLGGMLSSAVSILFWMSILNRFWPSAFLLDANLVSTREQWEHSLYNILVKSFWLILPRKKGIPRKKATWKPNNETI